MPLSQEGSTSIHKNTGTVFFMYITAASKIYKMYIVLTCKSILTEKLNLMCLLNTNEQYTPVSEINAKSHKIRTHMIVLKYFVCYIILNLFQLNILKVIRSAICSYLMEVR